MINNNILINVTKKLPFTKKIKLSLYSQITAGNTKLHQLSTLFWELTLRCNLNCRHCGSDCTKDAAIPDMKLEDFLKVLSEIKSVYDPSAIMIAMVGGEPLMRTDLEECGKAIRNLGFRWGTVTNGMLLTEKKFNSLLAAGLGSISVSLDGLKDSHTWMRCNKDSFENAVNAIRIIASQTRIANDVITCIHKKNINELDDIKKLLIGLGVKRWRIFNVFPKGRAKNHEGFALTNEEFVGLMEFIRQTRAEGLIHIDYACEGFLGNYEGEARDNYFFCRSGINVASIMADGSISGCLSCRRDYIQGSIYKDSFINLWENAFEMMRNRSWMKNGICKKCDVFKWCKGNGLHLRETKDDELETCHYNMILSSK
ncbi:MAG: radical SAM/SPASM domain-containing protein [Spirochaetes bacterium GWF1_31_7]|nr:MAG: radical SAM/SPASM domain-containing protein [Spirochaetes bacterium GWE1_32_154]OHD51194.1 MAG: radical SAM/SPASM domain-containing protein [Spirochaetes bacterium GWE2_31_10]OHD52113.1 MAG: radical SAM/SPASM domain-containing protein [Spirochaetes bacterium GWF1_31_7]OHD79752.1 MAG: radical SAM/SPASM domain-containing protein [Spirochaetes bacterium RIFOXYB1_FULL_32_8]HBD93288.1 radical SAM/SPASM domain-containing protein [Spirochaetia bacterium]